MKTNAIVRIILYSLVIAMLSGILAVGLLFDFSSLEFNIGPTLKNELESGCSIDPEQVSNLSIDWAAGEIVLRTGETQGTVGTITIIPDETDAQHPITYELDGNTLKLSYTNASVGLFSGSIPDRNLTILVPRDWICSELELNGAALKLTSENVTIGTLDIDGASCLVDLNGTVERVDCDGAACELSLKCDSKPVSIDLDGASCVLNLTLPTDCGFVVEMDGFGCDFNTALPYTSNNGKLMYGDQHCKITADGLSCEITINAE